MVRNIQKGVKKQKGWGKMKVTFDRDILNDAVTPAMSAVSSKNTIAAIEGIQIRTAGDRCILSSFDLEKGIRCEIPAQVEEEGCYIINGAKLTQIIRSMPGSITISVGKDTVAKIRSGRSEFTLHALDGEEFPTTPMLEGDWGFTIAQCELRDMISRTSYAVASNDPRPALNGLFFRIRDNKITAAASDSFRLAVSEKTVNLSESSQENKTLDLNMIVPGKTIGELMKMLRDTEEGVRILATRKHIIFFFEKEKLYFYSRLIDAQYIDYEKLIPKNATIFAEVSTSLLRESLERAALVTEDRALGQAKSHVKFHFGEDILEVSSVSANGSVFDEINIEKEGGELDIGFNCRYVLDALRAANTERIKLSLVSQLMAMVIEPAKDEECTEEKKEDGSDGAKAKKKRDTGVESESFIFLVVPIRMNS